MTSRLFLVIGLSVLPAMALAQHKGESHISSSSAAVGGGFNGLNIGTVIGADRFYSAGYTGTRAAMSNIESGHVWNLHETLGHTQYLPIAAGFAGTELGEFDQHATRVGQMMGGRGVNNYQRGIAYGAQLWSGSIATIMNSNGSFDWSNNRVFTTPYFQAVSTGLGGRTTDVINSSWGFADPANPGGSAIETVALDGMARDFRKTFVYSAGNAGPTTNTVRNPALGYNSIVVGSLGADTDANPYANISSFSSRGPSDYFNPVTRTTVSAVRARVDITAPGQNLTLAAYAGPTGSNTGGALGFNTLATNLYFQASQGTSFSSPAVAGSAALLYDVGYDKFAGGESVDPTVVKAVLLNSAEKNATWNNGQTVNLGVTTTTQALDHTYGAGMLDMDTAFDQYTGGTTGLAGSGGGSVGSVGWDFGSLSGVGTFNEYLITTPLLAGSRFTTTLNWMVERSYISTAVDGTISASDLSFADLNVQLFTQTGVLIAQSLSLYNNTEHFSFSLPSTDLYKLRVSWAGMNYGTQATQAYGIAWRGTFASSAPEPTTLALLLLGGVLARRSYKKKA